MLTKPRRPAAILLVTVFFTVFFCGGAYPESPADGQQWHRVIEVMTGDSFRLEGGAVIRYASAQSPDPLSPSEQVEGFAKESLAFNRSVVEGKRVRVEWGSRIRDAKGRYMGYVYTEDGTFVNLKVLQEGYAKLVVEPPNLEHVDDLQDAAMGARRQKKGLWKYERTDRPVVQFVGDNMKHIYHYGDCKLLDDVPLGHRTVFASSVEANSNKFTFCKLCRAKPSQNTDLF